MQYYVCNSAEPMGVPWGINAKFYTNEAEAAMVAKERAEEDPGTPFYVHEFSESVVIFKAASYVTVEAEYLGDNSVQG